MPSKPSTPTSKAVAPGKKKKSERLLVNFPPELRQSALALLANYPRIRSLSLLANVALEYFIRDANHYGLDANFFPNRGAPSHEEESPPHRDARPSRAL